MKKRELKELREMGLEALKSKLGELGKKRLNLGIGVSGEQEKDLKSIRGVKRDLAQLKTIIREMELGMVKEDRKK